MLRSVAVLMSALVAMSAQAEDAATREGDGKPARAAPSAESEQSPPDLAARQTSGSHSPALSPGAQPAQPDAASDATTPGEPNDCGMGQSFLDEGPNPVAIRFYEPAPAASPREGGPPPSWESPPFVGKAGRCHQKYVIQLKSKSKEPYEVKDAKLVGPDGEVLKAIHIRSRLNAQKDSITIVTVVRTKGIAEPNYRVAVELTGNDGRRIVIEDVELP